MPTTRSMPLDSTKKGTASERATSPKEQKSSSTAIVIRDPTAAGKTDTEVAQTFKADLQSLRTLVTCTICDQLLYEPWTLACGHTYCYSCLSSWFLVDKRKKTCPECRKAVKELPAPSFLVKQMVEIFIHRTELMPVDETTEQHRLRKEEENQIVEADRASNEGLFKGAFTSDKISKIYWDEEDGVERCRACSHEWTGGQSCDNCGVEFDNTEDMDRDFSETDLDEVDHIELDLDAELGDDFDADAYHAGFWRDALMDEEAEVDDYAFHPRVPRFLFPGAINPRTRRAPVIIDTDEDEEDSEDDDEGSLADFVVNDNTPHRHQRGSRRQVISLIDDEDEEEEEEDDDDEDSDTIYDGRRRRRVPHVPRAPSVVTVDSTSGESADERRIRGQGWSPLDYGQESDYSEGRQLMPTYDTEESDTSTIGGNQHSDEEDEEDEDVDEDDRESTPQFRSAGGHLRDLLAGRTRQRRRHVSVSTTSVEDGEADDDDSGDETSGLDRDGDIEMSVSPTASSHSSNMSPGEHGVVGLYNSGLGAAVSVTDNDDDESSDASVRPANRRRRHATNARAHDYDPRISRLFARHQSDLRDVTALQSSSFEDWNAAAPARVEPASRSRNNPAYRIPPPCPSPLRRSQSPVISITISGGRRNRGRRGQ